MELKFRLLNADEIQVRMQSVRTTKDKAKGVYLLYKDARCDMAILDETVTPMNWKKQYLRDNANCIVSIWDDTKGQWISKEDTGTESNTEAEKGLASDSFKRACFCWGIGRELYTAPNIVIYGKDENELKYLSLSVGTIQYDEKRRITKLVLVDDKGAVKYTYDKSVEEAKKTIGDQKPTEATKNTQPEGQVNRTRIFIEDRFSEVVEKLHNVGCDIKDPVIEKWIKEKAGVETLDFNLLTPEQKKVTCFVAEGLYNAKIKKTNANI